MFLFLAVTFAITWGAWWTLVHVVPVKGLNFNNPPIVALYLFGGFGPTIAALVAVALTPKEGAFREYASRLFRWRVNPLWYVVALALPALLTIACLGLVALLDHRVTVHLAMPTPWYVVQLFATMIIGGGLEELGWRGVAQPTLEKYTSRLIATAIIGVVWALWHLPLFFLPGVAQYGMNFALFALNTIGNAFFLAWLYAGTRSILLCVCFHAASNATAAMGLAAHQGGDPQIVALMTALIPLVLGIVLVGALPSGRGNPAV